MNEAPIASLFAFVIDGDGRRTYGECNCLNRTTGVVITLCNPNLLGGFT